jgi:nucleotide-binding universal stress UspA family protein
MMKRILVPIDSTTHAEYLANVVGDLARGAGATIRLLHVAPPPGEVADARGRIIAYADQETARLTAEADDMLLAVRAQLEGVAIESKVRFGAPAEEIVEEAEAFGADAIAVTTSCRSGLTLTLLGSVAEKVLRKARCAVLLVRPPVS